MEKITNDLFDIAWRIRAVDSCYELFFNKDKGRYEVWGKGILQSVLPFDRLDCRAVNYLRRTRIERLDALTAEIDRENERLENSAQNKSADEFLYKSKSLFGYLKGGGEHLPDYNDI